MSPAAVTQLAGLGTASEADVGDFAAANHTHALLMTTDERTKLGALPAAADLTTSLAGKMANTLPAMQAAFNAGTAPEKAAFQSSVSGYSVAEKERNITSRCLTTDSYDATKRQAMVWKRRRMFATVEQFRVRLTSSAIQGTNPRFGSTTPSTFRVSFMRPGDTLPIYVTFSGQTSGTETIGQFLVSDWMPYRIEAGTDVWWGVYQTNDTGLTYVASGNGLLSATEYCNIGVTVADITGAPPVAGLVSGYSAEGIVSITGMTRTIAALQFGDSIGRGQQDAGNAMGLCGTIDRTLGAVMPTINMCAPGSQINNWASSGFLGGMFSGLFNFCDVAAFHCGTNDIYLGPRTATQVLSDMTTATTGVLARVNALVPGMKVWWSTVAPVTTTSDAWATVAGQTVKTQEPERVTLNRGILGENSTLRAHPNYGGGIDISPAVETGWETGIGVAGWTADGTHFRTRIYARIESLDAWSLAIRRSLVGKF
jgi:hypothetical protein